MARRVTNAEIQAKAKPTGRNTTFTAEIAAIVCARLAAGETLREIGRDPTMPENAAVYDWLTKYDSFAEQYREARIRQAETWFEEMREVADDGRNDWMERQRRNGTITLEPNREHVERSKLRVNTIMWILSRMNPRKYGEKQQVEHSGSITIELASRLDGALKRLEAPLIDVTPDAAAVAGE